MQSDEKLMRIDVGARLDKRAIQAFLVERFFKDVQQAKQTAENYWKFYSYNNKKNST